MACLQASSHAIRHPSNSASQHYFIRHAITIYPNINAVFFAFRRLYPDEEPRILAQLQDTEDERVLFILALETAMRMRECYTLGVDQVSLPKRTISLERSKNGDTRQVPLSTTIVALLASYLTTNRNKIAARDGRLFPFWNGERDQTTLKALTSDLSARFARVFDAAGAADFHFHDLCGIRMTL